MERRGGGDGGQTAEGRRGRDIRERAMAAAALATRKRERGDDFFCHGCGRNLSLTRLPLPPPFEAFASTATSPATVDLMTAYGEAPLAASTIASDFRPFSLTPIFSLRVTAQSVPLPAPLVDPPVRLRVSVHDPRRCPGDGGAPYCKVHRHPETFVAELDTTSRRFLGNKCQPVATADVRQLLRRATSVGGLWAGLPVLHFSTDAAAKIGRYLRESCGDGSLGQNRIICQLLVTAVYPNDDPTG